MYMTILTFFVNVMLKQFEWDEFKKFWDIL